MKHTLKLALVGVTVATVLVGAAPAAAGTTVTVRVEGQSRTLLAPTSVHTRTGSITKGGAPKGSCPATRAAGALDAATHGRWGAKYYASIPGLFITSIFGEAPKGNDYWTVFINNVTAQQGICQLSLHRGDQLLFAVTNGSQFPTALRGPASARVGGTIAVKVLGYNIKGKATPLAGAHVTGTGVNARSDRQGLVHIHITHTGRLVLRASDRGFVRSAPLRIEQLP